MDQALTEEETLARLSNMVKFQLAFTIEPTPPPRPKKNKPKAKLKKRRKLPREVWSRDSGTRLFGVEEPSRKCIPKFNVTGVCQVFGRELKTTYTDVLPSGIQGTKEEIQHRFEWWVAEIYHSKAVKLGTETVEVLVPLQ